MVVRKVFSESKTLNEFVDGEILVAFKPETNLSKIEDVLAQYHYRKLFPDVRLKKSAPRDEQVLAQTYSLEVSVGQEDNVIRQLQQLYGNVIEFIERAPLRYII